MPDIWSAFGTRFMQTTPVLPAPQTKHYGRATLREKLSRITFKTSHE